MYNVYEYILYAFSVLSNNLQFSLFILLLLH